MKRLLLALPSPDGTFHLPGVEPGRYDVPTSMSDSRLGILEGIEVTAGQVDGLVLLLTPGGSVRVRHEGPETYASIACFHRGIQLRGDRLERDVAREFAVPAGTILVRVSYHESDLRTAERSIERRGGTTGRRRVRTGRALRASARGR